jgi:hypothetical protein
MIYQPLELVFSYVTTLGNWPRWRLSSLAVTGATDHSLEIGEQLTEELLVAGRLGRAVWTVVARDQPRGCFIDGQVAGSQNGGRVVHTFHPHGEAASVFEREFFYSFRNPFQRLVDRFLLRARIGRESADAVNRLCEPLEELWSSTTLSTELA